MYEDDIEVKKVQIAKVKVATLTAIIILTGILILPSGISLLTANVVIPSSGSISYGGALTRPLHVEGRYIKNDLGQTVILRGFNKQDFLDASTGIWAREGEYYQEESRIASFDTVAVRQHMQHWRDFWGMNVVRLHMSVSWWLNNYAGTLYWGGTDTGFRDAMIETVRIAEEEGIYVVPDFYLDADGSDQTGYPFPSAALSNRQDFVDLWVDVATRLGQFDNVLYEPWNEPDPESEGFSMNHWFNTAEAVINAIRALGDNHIIIMQYGYNGDLWWVKNWEDQGRPTENIVFSDHNYRWHGTFGGRGGDEGYDNPYTDDINYIRNFLWRTNGAPESVEYPNTGTSQASDREAFPSTGNNYGEVLTELNGGEGYPIWIGEVAPHSTSGREYNYFVNVMEVFSEWGIGWAYFLWDAPWGEWDAQQLTGTVFQPPNNVGQVMIDSIMLP